MRLIVLDAEIVKHVPSKWVIQKPLSPKARMMTFPSALHRHYHTTAPVGVGIAGESASNRIS
jgi:hypothetical protein